MPTPIESGVHTSQRQETVARTFAINPERLEDAGRGVAGVVLDVEVVVAVILEEGECAWLKYGCVEVACTSSI